MRDCGREAIALCMVATVLGGCGRGTPAPPARPTPDVTTVVAAPRDIPVTFEFVAQSQSSQSVNIQARVSGFLDKRVYTEGDVVRAGQVLFLIDPKPLQAQVDAAQAQLNNMQAALDVAKFNLDRTKPLTEQNAMSQKDLDDANGQYLTSKANVVVEPGVNFGLPTSRARSSTCRTRRSPRRSPASPAARSSPTVPTSAPTTAS